MSNDKQIVTHFNDLTDLVVGPVKGKRLAEIKAMPTSGRILSLKPIWVGNRTLYYVCADRFKPETGIIATTLDGYNYKGLEIDYFLPKYKQEILNQVSSGPRR
jgi:hypothetical protein